jgi:hypothetical protein
LFSDNDCSLESVVLMSSANSNVKLAQCQRTKLNDGATCEIQCKIGQTIGTPYSCTQGILSGNQHC